MKKTGIILFIFPLLFACSTDNSKTASLVAAKKDVIDIAVSFASGKFKDARTTTGSDGVITITDNQLNYVTVGNTSIKYIIDPSKIYIGLINEDSDEDAIITISSFKGDYVEIPEHLILIRTDGKFVMNRVIESNMKIMGIKDRVITAEVSSRSPNSPLRDCSECKEIVRFKFKSGDLIKLE